MFYSGVLYNKKVGFVFKNIFGEMLQVTVRPMLRDRYPVLSVPSVCNVGVL